MRAQDLVTRNAEAKKKYLDLYYEWMQNGLPNDGLCNCLGYFRGEDALFDLMRPQNDELENTRLNKPKN